MLSLFESKGKNIVDYRGLSVEIDLSFDAVLRCLELQKDKLFSDVEKLVGVFYILVPEHKKYEEILDTKDIANIVKTAFEIVSKDNIDYEAEEVMNFNEDAERIYSSFLKDYNINLIEEQGKLSWKEFITLLSNLSEDTPLMKAVYFRTVELPTGRENAEKRKYLAQMKKTFELESTKQKRQESMLLSMEKYKESLASEGAK